ncbi:MAG: DUF2892 domain-containing protein [Bacteroidales bacterium]
MKANMGSADKTIRIILAVLIGVLYFTNVISGTFGIILLIFGIIFLLTSLVSFCPLYFPLGISTKGKKE